MKYTVCLKVSESEGDSDTMTKTDYITVIKINNAPYTPPIVSNPSATPDTFLNDNGRPRIPGTNISQLSVTVTDDTEVDTVTIDLSPIGGSYEAQMTNIPGTDTWTITTNAVEGINIAHDLIVTATDTSGNSDSSVSIQLTILRRGDVDHDNDVDRADLMKIKYSMRNGLSVFIADVYPATGDNVVDRKDVFYIFDYVNGKADEP